jgi:hypothetical protein
LPIMKVTTSVELLLCVSFDIQSLGRIGEKNLRELGLLSRGSHRGGGSGVGSGS